MRTKNIGHKLKKMSTFFISDCFSLIKELADIEKILLFIDLELFVLKSISCLEFIIFCLSEQLSFHAKLHIQSLYLFFIRLVSKCQVYL